ncbi:MAG: glycosyltransferase family 2 protein [Bacteroidales bacterium]|nr:glycosyltransferase family 2 protein [Bacteroidales bacterium]
MKTLTFLVPCYNVENSVRRCLDSMLVESLLDDIEILAVNDGSTDGTLDILQEYADKYPTAVRVIDKPNGGWGTAINLGINEAQGRYIKEVDADDWVSSENLKEYVDFLRNNDIDYIATNYTEFFKLSDRYEPHGFSPEIYNKPMSLNDFWEQHPTAWDFPIHAITYRTQMLRDSGIRVGDRYYGDIEYNIYPLPHVQTICVLPINITVYFRGSDEQSTSTRGYARHYKDFAQMSRRLVQFHRKLPSTLQPNLYRFIERTVQSAILKTYDLMMSPLYAANTEGVDEELRQYDKWLKETDKTLYNHCGRHRKHGIAYIRLWRLFRINVLNLRK